MATRLREGKEAYLKNNNSSCSGGYAPQQAGGYDRRANNPYAQQDDNRFEMTQFNGQSNNQGYNQYGGGGGDDLTAFYDEISSIQDSIAEFNNNVQQISDLHSRSLRIVLPLTIPTTVRASTITSRWQILLPPSSTTKTIPKLSVMESTRARINRRTLSRRGSQPWLSR